MKAVVHWSPVPHSSGTDTLGAFDTQLHSQGGGPDDSSAGPLLPT